LEGTHGAGRRVDLQVLQHAGERQVPDAALAGARGLVLAGLGLDGVDQVLDRLVRRIGAHLQAGRIGVDEAERRVRRAFEVGQALPVHHADLDRDQADGVAVGRRLGDRAVADDARATGAVDHVDRLLQLLLEQRADDARGGVGAAARAPGDDQGDRPFRIGRGGNAGNDQGGERHGGAMQEFHGGLRGWCRARIGGRDDAADLSGWLANESRDNRSRSHP
jgi:hypothetical protein